jgi:hypothetical protein
MDAALLGQTVYGKPRKRGLGSDDLFRRELFYRLAHRISGLFLIGNDHNSSSLLVVVVNTVEQSK